MQLLKYLLLLMSLARILTINSRKRHSESTSLTKWHLDPLLLSPSVTLSYIFSTHLPLQKRSQNPIAICQGIRFYCYIPLQKRSQYASVNIKDRELWNYSQRLKTVNYCCKAFHVICLRRWGWGRSGYTFAPVPFTKKLKNDKRMKQKKIFYKYGCISTLPYIKGDRKGQKL